METSTAPLLGTFAKPAENPLAGLPKTMTFQHPKHFSSQPILTLAAITDLGSCLPEMLENICALLSSGVTLCFEEDKLCSDDKKFSDLIRVLSVIAEGRSRQASERIQTARIERSKEGDPVSISSYGYRRVNGKWEIEPSEARRVKMAFYLASQCACYMDIRNALDKMEEADKSGDTWNQTRLRYLLLNERYKGDMLTNKTWSSMEGGKRKARRNRGNREQFYVEDHHEPLVGAETFDLVGEAVREGRLKSNKKHAEDVQVKKMMQVGSSDPLLKCVH